MKKIQNRHFMTRYWLIASLLIIASSLVLIRAVELHVFNKSFLQKQGDARTIRNITTPAHRGMILDRQGEPLAISTPVESIWINPKQFLEDFDEHELAKLVQLEKLLGLKSNSILKKIRSNKTREFLYLKRHIEPDVAKQIKLLALASVFAEKEYRRYYPEGETIAHVVGFTNIDDHGQEGIELAYEKWLSGKPGVRKVLKDRLGRVVHNIDTIKPARPGEDLVLSIDRKLQYFAYSRLKQAVQEHKAESGSAVMIDVQTGEILALVNRPSYNPNNRTDRVSHKVRNRALTDVIEPGSTAKPFTIATALASGLYNADTLIDTSPGWIKVSGSTIRDHHNYGQIDVSTVIQKSSNVGMTQMALSLEAKNIWTTLDNLGFGKQVGIGLLGESTGTLNHYYDWTPLKKASVSFGYGFSATLIQLAQAYAVIAADGVKRPLSILKQDNPVTGERVMSIEIARKLKQMMQKAVTSVGTGFQGRVQGYKIAGKTGTVRKTGEQGYTLDSYIALFAGMAPATNPRIVLLVAVNDPKGDEYYGGQVAAPVFSDVMEQSLRLMNIKPDDVQWNGLQVAHLR